MVIFENNKQVIKNVSDKVMHISHCFSTLLNFKDMKELKFNKLRILFLLLTIITTLSSCLVTSQIVQVNDGNQEISLYSDNTILKKAYTEIIHMELTGSIFTSRKIMKSKLIEKAKENDCDAVINVKFKTTFMWPQAYGIGIRYEK
jgi:hypothetical protein